MIITRLPGRENNYGITYFRVILSLKHFESKITILLCMKNALSWVCMTLFPIATKTIAFSRLLSNIIYPYKRSFSNNDHNSTYAIVKD